MSEMMDEEKKSEVNKMNAYSKYNNVGTMRNCGEKKKKDLKLEGEKSYLVELERRR